MTNPPREQEKWSQEEYEQGVRFRINRCLRAYLPGTERDHPAGSPLVHRDFVADAFAAGMRAAVTVPVPDDEIAAEFEAYCEEAFTE